jgi:hypothetical protein
VYISSFRLLYWSPAARRVSLLRLPLYVIHFHNELHE